MNKSKKFWYAGYLAALLLVVLIAVSDFDIRIEIALSVLFSVIFAVSHTELLFHKMYEKDRDFKINLSDERLIAIREKSGNIVNRITLVLLGFATVLFIALGYPLPAVITGAIVALQPLFLIIVSRQIEKSM